ncbi:hypothetical protein ACOSP7_024827 [Xanthoceras sorbifolium]
MSSPVEKAMKEVDLTESSGEWTDSKPHPLAVITSTEIIDLDPEFGSGPSTVVVDDIPVGVAVSDTSRKWIFTPKCRRSEFSMDPIIHQAEVADVDRAGRLVGWRLDLFL